MPLRSMILALIAVWAFTNVMGATVAPTGRAGELIKHFKMQLVPQEGVWFAVSYLSEDSVHGDALPQRYGARSHKLGNAIVLVATRKQFSALHRLKTDETWHFYGGTPLDLLLLYPGGRAQHIVLGPDVLHGQLPQFTVPAGVWQGASPLGGEPNAYSFAGTQLAPAFDAADFVIGYRDSLQRQYPKVAKDIARLTRVEFAKAPPEAATADPEHAPGVVFDPESVPTLRPAVGVELKELVGRAVPKATTQSMSVAEFTLAPGRSTGKSLNRRALEVLLVTGGEGQIWLDGRLIPVQPNSIIYLPPGAEHEIRSGAAVILNFYAITAPAFDPADYVLLPP